MERYMLECKRRNDQLEQEKELRIEEERRKQELMKKRMEEKEEKERARKEDLKKQEALLKQEHLKAEEEERKRKAEADRQEQQRLKMQQEKQNQMNKQSDQAKKDAERREYERKQMEARKAEEEVRRREMETMQNVELTYRSPADQKPGDLHGFGFGNVRTGQVSTKKISFLTRSSSVERGDLNPEVSTPDGIQSRSARASPLPQMSLQKFQEPSQSGIDDVKGPKSVQWSQQP